jgi:hypothetical protein
VDHAIETRALTRTSGDLVAVAALDLRVEAGTSRCSSTIPAGFRCGSARAQPRGPSS